jgi:hypothetical protein
MYGEGITLPPSILKAQEEVETSSASPVMVERHVQPTSGKKMWETPILDRGKLRDHLNELAKHNFEIFAILPLDRTTVQVVCYVYLPEPSTEE